MQDSMYRVNTAESVTEMETKYDVQKKQHTIIHQQYDLAKKNYLLYGSSLLILLGAIFSFILFKQNKKKQELKKVLYINDIKGNLYPMKQIPADQKELKGFQWLDSRRPKNKLELFE